MCTLMNSKRTMPCSTCAAACYCAAATAQCQLGKTSTAGRNACWREALHTCRCVVCLTRRIVAPSRQAGPSVQPAPGPAAPPHCAKAFGGAMMPASHQVHVLQLVNVITTHKRQTSGPTGPLVWRLCVSPHEAPSWMKSCSRCAYHRHTWATTRCGCRFALHSRGGRRDGSCGSRQSCHVGHGGGGRRRGRDAAQIGRKATEAVVRIWDGGSWSSSLGGQRDFRKAGGRRDGGCRRSGGSDHTSGSCRAASCGYLALSSRCCYSSRCSSSGCSAQLSVV